MEVQPDDLLEAAAACRSVLEPLVEHDWAVTAGDLSWDVRTTITHVCDAVGWYAAHLAAQSRGRLRFDFHAHDNASNAELLDVFDAAAATLAQVARGGSGWRPRLPQRRHGRCLRIPGDGMRRNPRPRLGRHPRPRRGVRRAPADLAARVLGRLFPWAPTDTPPWQTLLWANGRVDLSGRFPRLGPDWVWHCAPPDEWDGTVPHEAANPPSRYEWVDRGRRWSPRW